MSLVEPDLAESFEWRAWCALQDPVTEELYQKLVKAKESRAVIVSHPTAVKSFVLKVPD